MPAPKSVGRKTYKTLQGKLIDMDLLRQKNELTPAVGNMRVNARGDELGPGGKIVRKKEDVVREYYDKAVGMPDENISASSQRPAPSTEKPIEKTIAKKTTKKKDPLVIAEEDWVEDADGNFVPKDA